MIVVIAFMRGFQEKFRTDIIDAQGHARVVSFNSNSNWSEIRNLLSKESEVSTVSPYLQGHLFLQNRTYNSTPFAIGLDPAQTDQVLPLEEFLKNGQLKMKAEGFLDVTPSPTINHLEDEVVFITRQIANKLGVRPVTAIQLRDQNESKSLIEGKGKILLTRLDPYVRAGLWTITFQDKENYKVEELMSGFAMECKMGEDFPDLGPGYPLFVVKNGSLPFEKGDTMKFKTFRSSILEVYSPSMIEKAKANELAPPKEVRVGGVFEVPWQGFHAEALIGTMRFMEDTRGEEEICDGFYLKFTDELAQKDDELLEMCRLLEEKLGKDWLVIPWFVENAWFFELLKFEEYLMVLIMIPIGLVAAFAIAIALMTTVLRKVREIGLLVAMGGKRLAVGAIFCLQGFIIGTLGAILGCGLALIFITYRDALMSFIVSRIAGESGQAEVTQFYDFYSLDVPYPWHSWESLSTFLSFAFFAVVVSTVAGLIPAWRAAKMNPAEALRSE